MSADYESLMQHAAETNARRDVVDSGSGFAPPHACPLDVALQTVDAAIEAGLRFQDWECIAEGLDILRTIAATQEITTRRSK